MTKTETMFSKYGYTTHKVVVCKTTSAESLSAPAPKVKKEKKVKKGKEYNYKYLPDCFKYSGSWHFDCGTLRRQRG